MYVCVCLVQYVKPFTFGLWAAQVEYFDDDHLQLDEHPPVAEEDEEVVNRHAIARVALFVANELTPLMKYDTPTVVISLVGHISFHGVRMAAQGGFVSHRDTPPRRHEQGLCACGLRLGLGLGLRLTLG